MKIDSAALNRYPVLIIPGWQDSDESHWQTKWEKAFDWKRVVQTEWMNPRKDEWVRTLIEAIRRESIPPVLVSHSLGGTTIAHAVQKDRGLRVAAAFLVAPPDLEQADTPKEILDFRPTPLVKLPFPSVLVASSNDPLSALTRSEELAKHWGSEFVCVGDRHHLGGMANLGTWEEGKTILAKFLATLGAK